MAKKFTDLNELTVAATDDVVAIVDVSANETKRITLANLLNNFIDAVHIKANAIIEAKLLDGAVTTRKFKPTTINSSNSFVVQGSRFITSSTSFVAVPGCTMNYTSGPTAERLYLWLNIMAYSTPGNSEAALFVDSVQQAMRLYIDPGTPWGRMGQMYIVDVPANTTVALSVRVFAASGSQCHVTNENANWMPTIRGFSVYNGA